VFEWIILLCLLLLNKFEFSHWLFAEITAKLSICAGIFRLIPGFLYDLGDKALTNALFFKKEGKQIFFNFLQVFRDN